MQASVKNESAHRVASATIQRAQDAANLRDSKPATSKAHPVPDRRGANLYVTDGQMESLLKLYLPEDLFLHLLPHFTRMGELAGGRLDDLAGIADKNPPALEHRTRSGENIQRIIKHPAYEEMERVAYGEFGLQAMSHREDMLGWKGKLPPIVKYALTYLFVQAEFGLCCPLSMTDSLTRTLKKFGRPELLEKYLPQLLSLDWDEQAQGAMFMTEQAAGSDISNTATMAYPNADGSWRLVGDKWFCSNPDAEFAMVLARVDGDPEGMKGISLFLLPRYLDDGGTNRYRIIRLKEKLGTRSMASGEITLEGAKAYLVGERGRGFVQMADMVNNSRLSNGVRSAGMMRRAVAEAEYVAHARVAFGKRLEDMPLMRRQLDKLRVPAEQARTMVFQTAQVLARADAGDQEAYALLRILTPMIKFRACRDARKVTGDAMEVRGGCGYIEEWSDPRLVRDAHLGSIWEGTSNIVALDVIRAIRREGSLPVLQKYLSGLLSDASLSPAYEKALRESLSRASALAEKVVEQGLDQLARQTATALYCCTTAIAMAWEASKTGSKARMRLSQLVVVNRLLPRDPLGDEGIIPAAWF
ncbi:acyl-CoA dehydrogenase family protein [Diaphorobacter caeni]|uniref:acyl-CoA dehydrogenase family protein n=1 Tax=Diaphorobacter caeni TaxID=2784387 RepID=UPI00188DEB90|nr:acyl-CoA dehydrogenase family protein [Diaphorobacter caeni]MBF5006206.1 acyl-CoA dehydrogenase family protein [Diaphorobacter caeni]